MPFVPAANTAAIDVVFSLDGQIVENTLYYQATTTPGATELASLVEVVTAYIKDEILPFLHAAISLVRVVGTLIDVIDGLQYTSTTGLPAAGAGTGPLLPNNVSFCISFRTGLSGRSGRGRNYIAGINGDTVAGNTFDNTWANNLVTAYAGLQSVAGDDGWQQVVVSRFTAGAPRTTALVSVVTSTLSTDHTVDSQRRRLPGRGS